MRGAPCWALQELELCVLEVRSARRGVITARAEDVHDRIGVVDASLAFDVLVGIHIDPVRFELPVALADHDVSSKRGLFAVGVGNGVVCVYINIAARGDILFAL